MSLELDDLDRAVGMYWAARNRRLRRTDDVQLPSRSGGLDSDDGQGEDDDSQASA